MLLLSVTPALLLLTPGGASHRSRGLAVAPLCSRARAPLLCSSEVGADEQAAAQAVAWFDDLTMLQIFYMGDLRHDEGAADADTIEAAIAASGGNVSRFLTPDERTMPRAGDAALAALAVSFSVEVSDGESDARMPSREVRLRVRFPQGYPLQGERPSFELLHDVPASELPQDGADAVVAAAEASAAKKAVMAEKKAAAAAAKAAFEAKVAAKRRDSLVA